MDRRYEGVRVRVLGMGWRQGQGFRCYQANKCAYDFAGIFNDFILKVVRKYNFFFLCLRPTRWPDPIRFWYPDCRWCYHCRRTSTVVLPRFLGSSVPPIQRSDSLSAPCPVPVADADTLTARHCPVCISARDSFQILKHSSNRIALLATGRRDREALTNTHTGDQDQVRVKSESVMSSSSAFVDIGYSGWLPSVQSLSVLIVPSLLIALILYLCEHQYDDILGVPPPGPWGLPILGYLPFLDVRAPHKSLQALARRYGSIFQLRMGSVRAVILSDVALVREFFRHEVMTARAPLYLTHGIMGGYGEVSCWSSLNSFWLLSIYLGLGIICAQGDIWRHARREVIDWLKALGMTRRQGERRTQLEQRIARGVDECVEVSSPSHPSFGKNRTVSLYLL